MLRKIIHIDMDAFFAAVEQRDFPEYRNRPLIVGGSPNSRGVVATCSYEARKFGIHSAMPCSRAARLCPQAVFVRPRFEVYKKISQTIRDIFQKYSDVVEPLSIDEAYLDVSNSPHEQGSATLIAQKIRSEIKAATALTASAGISYNKFLAKVASDINKPDGQFVITPENGEAFIAQLEIGRFYGIGKATEAKMKKLGIHNGADLRQWRKEQLIHHFGKAGHYYHAIARGIDNRTVGKSRQRKSIGTETTFAQDLYDPQDISRAIHMLGKKLAAQLQYKHFKAQTFTLKVKFADFRQITRSFTHPTPLDEAKKIIQLGLFLWQRAEADQQKIRLLGITASQIRNSKQGSIPVQLSLFSEQELV